ncbi:MAG: hypothetical protein ABIC91_05275 [Nanoarchaeota archaeon]
MNKQTEQLIEQKIIAYKNKIERGINSLTDWFIGLGIQDAEEPKEPIDQKIDSIEDMLDTIGPNKNTEKMESYDSHKNKILRTIVKAINKDKINGFENKYQNKTTKILMANKNLNPKKYFTNSINRISNAKRGYINLKNKYGVSTKKLQKILEVGHKKDLIDQRLYEKLVQATTELAKENNVNADLIPRAKNGINLIYQKLFSTKENFLEFYKLNTDLEEEFINDYKQKPLKELQNLKSATGPIVGFGMNILIKTIINNPVFTQTESYINDMRAFYQQKADEIWKTEINN